MNYASLLAFLNGELPSSQFSEEISPEVDECYASMKATRQGYILTPEGPEITGTRAHARRLLLAMADKSLSLEAASYVADCVIMSHCFVFGDDEAALEAMHFASDDSAPRPTDEMIQSVLKGLGRVS